jgi:transcriptional regulator with XRE-family HTH domain
MTTRTEIAERIAAQAKEKFKKQSDFAHAAGMTQGAISHYYAGKRVPSAEMVPAIARALGVSMEYLLTGEDSKPQDNAAEEWKSRALAAEAKLAQLSALLGSSLPAEAPKKAPRMAQKRENTDLDDDLALTPRQVELMAKYAKIGREARAEEEARKAPKQA